MPISSFSFRAALAACALLLLACAGRFLPHPGAAQAEYASRSGNPATVNSLEEGRALYTAKCDGCHVLPGIGAHTPENWDRILNRMKVEAKLTPREDHLVRTYVISSAAWMQDAPPAR